MVLTIDDLHRLIAQWENTKVEFKSELSESVVRDLPTSICAFANSQGGIMVFGVTNSGDPTGLELKGDERERISQAAEKCRPSVSIDIEQIPFGKRNFLVVEIPRSRIVHSDTEQRFPKRIGSITSYLDAPGLLALIEERELVRGRAEQESTPASEQKRVPLSPSLESSIPKALDSKTADVRIQVLMDLSIMVYEYYIFESEKIAGQVGAALKSENEEETRLALDLARSVSIWGTDNEKKQLAKMLPDIIKIATSSGNPTIARSAFDVVQSARELAAKDILEFWICMPDDKFYDALGIPNMLVNIGFYGLKEPIRDAMYSMLSRAEDETTKKRIVSILEAVRRSHR